MAYFPNGSAGEVFDRQCEECLQRIDDVLCPVALVQTLYNYDQLKAGEERLKACLLSLVSEDGTCNQRIATTRVFTLPVYPFNVEEVTPRDMIQVIADKFGLDWVGAREIVESVASAIKDELTDVADNPIM